MKKLLAMIALGAVVTGSSFAQTTTAQKDRKPRTERSAEARANRQGTSPEERAAKRTEMLAKKYNLSAAQQAKLNALHARQSSEMSAMRGQRGQKAEMSQQQREALKAKRSQYNNELKAIFTPEQYARFEADRKTKGNGEHKGKRGEFSKRAGTKKEVKS